MTIPTPGQYPWIDDLNDALVRATDAGDRVDELYAAQADVLEAAEQVAPALVAASDAVAARDVATAAAATASGAGEQSARRVLYGPAVTNLVANPSMEQAGSTVIVRENLATRPTSSTASAFEKSGSSAATPATFSREVTGGGIVPSFDRLTFPAGAAPAGGSLMLAAIEANRPAVAVGDMIAASWYVRSSIAQQVRPRIQWLTSSTAGNAGSSTGATLTLVPNTWTRVSITGTAPAGSTHARADLDVGGTTIAWPEGSTLDAQALLIERHGAVLPWFDGSTAAAGDFTYSWSGTVGASVSRQNGLGVANAPGTNVRAIQSGEWASTGTKSLRLIAPLGVTAGAYVRLPESNGLVNGKTYTLRARARVATVSGIASSATVRSIRFLPSAGSQVFASAPDVIGVHELAITFTMPATGTASLDLYAVGALAGTPDVWFDDVMLIEGATLVPYADGSTPGWSWTGTAHASTSRSQTLAQLNAAVPAGVADVSAVPLDGTTDGQPALQAALSSGATYVRLPKGATIAINNPIAIPDGVTLDANGATLKVLRALTTFAVTVASNVTIRGRLTVDSPAGDTAGVELVGSNIAADSIRVVVADGQPQGGIVGDGAVLSRSFGGTKTGVTIRDGAGIRVGRIQVVGFEYAAIIQRVQGIRVGDLQVRRYKRGLFVEDSKHVWVDGGLIEGASPWAAPNPGHNGVILEATAHDAVEDVHFRGVVVRDSGEHGWRLGGAYRIRKLWVDECSAINVGRGGFKVLGGAPEADNWHEDLWFDNVLVEDAGQQETNAGGIMIGYARRVQINNPVIRALSKPYSAGFAIHVIGGFDIVTTNPLVKDAMVAAYCVEYTKGDQMNISLVGGQLHSHGDTVRIDWTIRALRRVTIEGFPILSVTGAGMLVRLVEGGTLGGGVGTLYNGCHITWTSTDSAGQQVGGNGAYRMQAEVRAAFDSAAVLRDGSTWKDIHTGAIRIRKGNTWVQL